MVSTALDPASEADVSLDTMIPDLLRAHPQARNVLDEHGLSGCGGRLGPVESLGFFAKAHGVEPAQMLKEIRRSLALPVLKSKSEYAPSLADTIYRRYFLAAIVVVLTAGASWGAIILWQIGFAGKFTGVGIQEVNAHGQAQIYGWVGLFIIGFACQAFPRMWQTKLAAPRLAAVALALMVAGIATRTVAITLGSWTIPAALTGCVLQIASILIFAGQIATTWWRSSVPLKPYIAFVLSALFFMIAQAGLDLWHTYATMTATSQADLLWHVATFQAPLRDLQVHGMAVLMIFGVCIRMMPALFGVAELSDRRAWTAFAVLASSIVSEVAIFLTYRFTGVHWFAAFLMLPWLGIAAGCAIVALPWRLWRPLPVADRSAKFVRVAFAWLVLSLVLLLLLPVYQAISHIPFSHAYYGAIRHAITVGFISLMIMGMAAKVVPTLNGVDPRKLPTLTIPFLLINLGFLLIVSLQILTDWHSGFYSVVGISGICEVTALAVWGTHLIRIMRAGKRDAASSDLVRLSVSGGRIAATTIVADIIAQYPKTLAVFESFGFTLLRNPIARRTIARTVTLEQAAKLRSVDLPDLLQALRQSARSEN
jgi:hypothetical protein